MPLKHKKRTDYLRRQRTKATKGLQDSQRFTHKVPITRRDELPQPEDGQQTIDGETYPNVSHRDNKQT